MKIIYIYIYIYILLRQKIELILKKRKLYTKGLANPDEYKLKQTERRTG